MPRPQNKEASIPVRLDVEDVEQLEAMRSQSGIGVSALIRAAVKMFLKEVKKTGSIPIPGPMEAISKSDLVQKEDTINEAAKKILLKAVKDIKA